MSSPRREKIQSSTARTMQKFGSFDAAFLNPETKKSIIKLRVMHAEAAPQYTSKDLSGWLETIMNLDNYDPDWCPTQMLAVLNKALANICALFEATRESKISNSPLGITYESLSIAALAGPNRQKVGLTKIPGQPLQAKIAGKSIDVEEVAATVNLEEIGIQLPKPK